MTKEEVSAHEAFLNWRRAGFSADVAAWTVYMSHTTLKPVWLEAYSTKLETRGIDHD